MPIRCYTARRLDVASCLQQLAAAWALDLRVECVDVKRTAIHDLSLPRVRDSYLRRIRAKEFDAVLLSPPCLPRVRDSYLRRIRAKEFDAVLLSPPCSFADRGQFAAPRDSNIP